MKEQSDCRYYFVKDVMQILDLKERKAYEVISTLNQELAEMGKMTFPGRVPKNYFHLRTDVEVQEVKRNGRVVKEVV